ncbi:MAG: hypothetical protein H6719_32550 [Sandaracinaceae bacterium]|nr:hypothetical protein [Sandaracinaceae bacterium]
MHRIEITRDLDIATRPLKPPSDAFRATVVAAAQATTGLHELYVLQYVAASLTPSRGVLFAILAAPGADIGAAAREFHSQVALRFDRTESFHFAVGTTANAALIPHCVPEALWHRTRFTERPPARRASPTQPPRSVAPRSVAPPTSIPPAPRLPSFTPPSEPPTRAATLADLVDRHVLTAWDRQDWHLEVHEGCSATLDLALGELVLSSKGLFAKRRRYRVQLLGAEQGRAWRWSWADGDRSIPEALRASAHTLRRRGEREQVPELTTPSLPLGDLIDGELLACVATGLLDATFYFRVPTDTGALYVLVTDPAFPKHDQDPVTRSLSTIPRAFAAIAIPNHYAAVAAYFRAQGLRVDEQAHELTARSPKHQAMRAEFDDRGRLTVLESI